MIKVLIRRFLKLAFINSLLKIIFLIQNNKILKKTNNDIYEFSDKRAHIFFGYYDITPFSNNDKYLLAQRIEIRNRIPRKDDYLSVGYYELNNNNFIEIGNTNCWNWQQGCRMQWFTLNNVDTDVIYNRIVDNNYGSSVHNILTKKIIREYQYPIYSLTSDSKYALTLNFSRLGVFRPGYGYNNFKCKNKNICAPSDDGIWLLDMESGKVDLLFSIKDVINIEPKKTMDNATHYFNHLSPNPNGNRFLFLHIWILNKKRYTRLVTADMNGKNLYVLNNEGMSSHYCWKTDNQILSYALDSKGDKKFFIYYDMSKKILPFGEKYMLEDGHPTFSINDDIVCDTYPNLQSKQTLFTYNYKKNVYNKITSFFNPSIYYGEFRCDLHPRWNSDGNKICVDSPNTGLKRKMYIINI